MLYSWIGSVQTFIRMIQISLEGPYVMPPSLSLNTPTTIPSKSSYKYFSSKAGIFRQSTVPNLSHWHRRVRISLHGSCTIDFERQNYLWPSHVPPLTGALTRESLFRRLRRVLFGAPRKLVPFSFPRRRLILPERVLVFSLRHALLWLRTAHGNFKVDRSLALIVAIHALDCFKVFRIVVIEKGPNVVFPEISLIRTADVDTFEASSFTECSKTRPVVVRNADTHVPQLLARLK